MKTKASEYKILNVVRLRSVYFEFKRILKIEFFSSEETKLIFAEIQDYHQTYKTKLIPISSLYEGLYKKVKGKEDRKRLRYILRKIKKCRRIDREFLKDVVIDFSKRQTLRSVVMEAIDLIEQPRIDLQDIKDKLEEASNITSINVAEFYNYFNSPSDRVKLEHEEPRIATLVKPLDEHLSGGIGNGELGVYMGPPGRGKTLALVNMGVGAMLQGKKVAHVTLEIEARKVATRYDLRFTNLTFDQLIQQKEVLNKKLAYIRKMGGDLIIKDYCSSAVSVSEIRQFLINNSSKTKRGFDLLIIDYGDLVSTERKYKEPRFELGHIYTAMRRLAQELKIPVWTASQTTRDSLSKPVITMKDVAESFEKVKVADIVITICQTEEEEQDDLCRLFVCKSRRRKGHPSVMVSWNPDTMFMGKGIDRKSGLKQLLTK